MFQVDWRHQPAPLCVCFYRSHLHYPDKGSTNASPKCLYSSTKLHGVITEQCNINIHPREKLSTNLVPRI